MYSLVAPSPRNVVVPPDAGPGEARIVIGPDLPPPLDTYVLSGGATFSAAMIWYANDVMGPPLDATYTFEAAVDDGTNYMTKVVRGHVLNGAVVETSTGLPEGQYWSAVPGGSQTDYRIAADTLALLSNGGGWSSASSVFLSGASGVSVLSSGGDALIDAGIDVVLDASDDVRITAADDITATATDDITISAGGDATVTGAASARMATTAAGTGTVLVDGNGVDISTTGGSPTRVGANGNLFIASTNGYVDITPGNDVRLRGTRAYLLTSTQEAELAAPILLGVGSNIACTINVTTGSANARYCVTIVCDFSMSVAAATLGIGEMSINGAVRTPQALLGMAAAGDRATVTQTYRGTLATAGGYTFRQLVRASNALGTKQANSVHTRMTIEIFEA